jgi:hypothetical protein
VEGRAPRALQSLRRGAQPSIAVSSLSPALSFALALSGAFVLPMSTSKRNNKNKAGRIL